MRISIRIVYDTQVEKDLLHVPVEPGGEIDAGVENNPCFGSPHSALAVGKQGVLFKRMELEVADGFELVAVSQIRDVLVGEGYAEY